MRKQLRVILLFAFLCSFCVQARTQNLVPNPSFEYLVNCPFDADDFIQASPWIDVGPCSSNIFNPCMTFAIPQNLAGWQQPRTGNSYAGISVYNYYYPANNVDIREYIGVQLIDTLEAGKKYCVEFYASLGDSCFWFINRLGLALTNTAINPNCGPYFTPIAAEYPSSSMFTNKTDWIKISGLYTATGGEQYLTIGNFYPDSLTDTISGNGPNISAYFYIDDVSVTECPEPPPLVSSLIVPNAFSPNGDGINDFFSPSDTNLSFYTCKIFNRWGNLIFETTNPNQFWDGKYNGGDCVDGTYFYLIESVGLDDKKYLYKGFLMLAR
jgi:gliding motility-associated-like protein